MLIERKAVTALLPADYNPRKDLKPGDAEYEKLKRSIEQFGYVEPVIWNKTTGRVVGGHQRLKVLIDMGMTEVDCVVVELTEEKEKRLSEIIDEINSRTGKSYDNDVVVKAMLQIRDILMKSEKLKTSAKNNTQQDFEFSYFDDIDDALIEGLSQNQDFFSLLLSNDEMKRQVLGIFADEIYKSLRSAD